MSGGIGGIGSMGNLGLSQMSSMTKISGDIIMSSVHNKKHHEEDTSFAATLTNLNTHSIPGSHSGAGGETGTRINKFA